MAHMFWNPLAHERIALHPRRHSSIDTGTCGFVRGEHHIQKGQ
uniref:Uncharacterized protein n=1 Tax=Arundo donax TaxID=35708 RepID=A0A0A9FZ76_ARUDO